MGLSLLAVLTNLPVVGFFFKLVVIAAGLGSLVLAIETGPAECHIKPVRPGMAVRALNFIYLTGMLDKKDQPGLHYLHENEHTKHFHL
ncbi:MAG: hypothetical protein M1119_06310 [Firmicutes bacterium]|nr:hypothetical protein [Bacillota bacterium]